MSWSFTGDGATALPGAIIGAMPSAGTGLKFIVPCGRGASPLRGKPGCCESSGSLLGAVIGGNALAVSAEEDMVPTGAGVGRPVKGIAGAAAACKLYQG